jgi:ATP-dependent Clp protease protease subunit
LSNKVRFWNFTVAEEDVELRISGDIVDDDMAWLYEWFGETATSPNAFRNELKKHNGKKITLWIDSYGGDVVAAAGIYHALREHKGKVTVKIDNKAMSAASVIAMAGDTIEMSPMSLLMIHNPWTGVRGEAKDMRHTADVLDTIKDSIINAYQLKTGLKRADIADMMDAETWMSAKTAVEKGFADSISLEEDESLDDVSALKNSFNRLSFQNSLDLTVGNIMEMIKAKRPAPDDSRHEAVNLSYQTQILLNRRTQNV